jgi:hypothetical protein
MSSQGPAISSSGFISYTGFTGTAIVPGYTFSRLSIRDSSDWISFKKQSLIAREGPVGISYPSDPWIPFGGDRRLDYMNGRYKLGGVVGCTGCTGAAFTGNGNPY